MTRWRYPSKSNSNPTDAGCGSGGVRYGWKTAMEPWINLPLPEQQVSPSQCALDRLTRTLGHTLG
jgi:hypothetical protein